MPNEEKSTKKATVKEIYEKNDQGKDEDAHEGATDTAVEPPPLNRVMIN